MELKQLNLNELSDVYLNNAVNDFPKDELKPFSVIKQLYIEGIYQAVGLFENNIIVAYALFLLPMKSNQPFLDYYAVSPDKRGCGIGGTFLSMLKEHFSNSDCIVLEVETPSTATSEQDRLIREKRIAFYLKNHAEQTNVYTEVYGVEFNIMFLPCSDSDFKFDTREYITSAYKDIFGNDQLNKYFILK